MTSIMWKNGVVQFLSYPYLNIQIVTVGKILFTPSGRGIVGLLLYIGAALI